ncbi:HupE/UreJ family protein [Leptospira kirschneri]|uniref:HupE/UreJ family protein n=1 Tax=Leptospira kirschneri TaxID=29507 RepID=UPI0002784F5E|nr:HupE/UreJ family protein [Leptospira kirschneri]EJO70208.1 HupE/UreJ protein [Leptospira kirschneri serovar Grippotyphosa str. RM52]EKQ84651.1 HupE/UreJ protein [Leptospira kirschneri serovar Grippotyphosa str. Moskva]EKR07979.1 HupE/UreJ protein [Leptospira kirschneri serovar Valbuzzi str. 200702274]EMK02463.1 HupE/UreJ protein [Leptospira kirschneri str. MMD1493]EPG48857.1 HupE/UreJ protein [Leptospira kirschneri serovar Cynopteri str. 3522 CT]
MKKIIYFIIILFFSNEVFSHNRSESFSVWKVDKNILSGVITIPIREVTRIPFLDGETGDLSDHFASYIRPHIVVRSGDKECFLSTPIRPLKSNSAFIRLEMIFQCENKPPDFMIYTGFYAPSHLHYSRLNFEDGNISENLFQSKRTEWGFKKESASQSSGFLGFVFAGIEHIGTGVDHIVFLLAVLLASKHWKEVLLSITGFTLGHSFTLSIATLNKIKPDTSGIEAFIGLTILIVAAKSVLVVEEKRSQIPFWVASVPLIVGWIVWSLQIRETHILFAYIGMSFFTFCYLSFNQYITNSKSRGLYLGITTLAFGMIHGFGFAGFLLETGLDRDHLLIPLLGFNLGVEIGQLVLISLILGVVWCLFRKIKSEFKELTLLYLLFLLAVLGTYWFFQRSFQIHS